jgi:hypothetical protein
MSARPLDAGAIVGLLADDDRRLVLAAVELGHGTVEAIAEATSLPSARAAKAAGRLAEAGVIVQVSGALRVDGDAFRAAARAALARPRSDELEDAPDEVR